MICGCEIGHFAILPTHARGVSNGPPPSKSVLDIHSQLNTEFPAAAIVIMAAPPSEMAAPPARSEMAALPARSDFVVLGATGYTAWWVVKELVELGLNFCVAGRSKDRLQAVLDDQQASAPIVLFDFSDQSTVERACAAAKVVINCTGPYRLYGEAVVQACLAVHSSYVDITGEPEFMESMVHKYSAAAQQAGVTIVNSCGFDSLPADVGFEAVRARLIEQGATPHTIESFLTLCTPKGGPGHVTTLESAILGFENAASFRRQRRAWAVRYCSW